MIDKIYCENCLDLMARMAQNNNKVDIILTSPPYGNSIKISDKSKEKDMANTAHGSHSRYDVFDDTMSPEEYTDFVKNLFMHFDQILKPDGVILYNFSYSAQSVERTKMYWDILNMINNNTSFLIIDQITWKKTTALPIPAHNKLSRVCENVFAIARKNEFKTFKANKPVSKTLGNQVFYEYVTNFIEAPNNDGVTLLNRATFSSELVVKLLKLYCYSKDCIVYDPFMGTGTTALGCLKYGCHYLGSELSPKQCEYAENRLKEYKDKQLEDW